jgi:hypothetical protein
MGDWRSHAIGLNLLIEMRGGIRTLLKQSPYLSPTLSVFVLYVIPFPKIPSSTLTSTQHNDHGQHMLSPLGPTRHQCLPRILHLRHARPFPPDIPLHALPTHPLLLHGAYLTPTLTRLPINLLRHNRLLPYPRSTRPAHYD